MGKIDYEKTKNFWDKRAEEYRKVKLESITTFEDFPELMDYIRESEKSHLFKKVNIKPEMKILDLGCGVGRLSFMLAPSCKKIVAVDFSGRILDIAREEAGKRNINNIDFIQSTVETFFYDEKFDVILIYSVFIYVNDDEIKKTIDNAYKMLKDGGVIVSRETIATGERIEKVEQYMDSLKGNYNVIYRPLKDYISMFREAGFALAYENYSFPPIVLPASVFRCLVPPRSKKNKFVKYIIRVAFKINLLLDPILLKLSFIYRIIIKLRNYTEIKYLCIYKKGNR